MYTGYGLYYVVDEMLGSSYRMTTDDEKRSQTNTLTASHTKYLVFLIEMVTFDVFFRFFSFLFSVNEERDKKPNQNSSLFMNSDLVQFFVFVSLLRMTFSE